MERVRRLLLGLFRQVLSGFWREVPTLTDNIIDSERPDPRLAAYFSNRHRASVTVRADDIYDFCQLGSAWNSGSIRSALPCEGRPIHMQMGESGLAQIDTGMQNHQDSHRSRAETLQFATRHRLRDWWNRQRFIRERRLYLAAAREARDRGMRLLIENLSPAQRAQYDESGYFDVTGGETGKRYRITRGRLMNVDEIGKNGNRVRMLCFMPEGVLVLGDVMLAQKLALELFESQALSVANTSPARHHRLGPLP
jgi:hypothetical protein